MAGVGNLACSVLLDWLDRDVDPQAIVNWAHGYWSGYNLYRSATCKEMYDLSSVDDEYDTALALIAANCRLDPDRAIVFAAYRVLTVLPEVPGTRSADCGE
jgi:hypothetical protein